MSLVLLYQFWIAFHNLVPKLPRVPLSLSDITGGNQQIMTFSSLNCYKFKQKAKTRARSDVL